MSPEDRLFADYVVIGSGIAGLYTAICLAPAGRVVVLSKQDLVAGNTWFAQGGIAAAFSAEDSPKLHLEDTWKAGACFGDRSSIGVLVEEANFRIQDLLAIGVNFDRRDGAIDLGQEGAHSRKRILHIGGDATGKELVEALLLRAKSAGVIFIEEAFARRLTVEQGCCRGVEFMKEGCSRFISARAVILATGGCGQIFECTTNAPAVTGDGLVMAFQAGAALQDLEFFQFHPTVFFPPRGNPFLITEAVRGEGAHLINKQGEYFMERFHPRGDLGPRDVVARAILAEQQRTGAEIYLDLRHLGLTFAQERFPTIYSRCLEWGLDISRSLIPVSPAAHYLIGGIKVDLDGRTGVENLFAVGEAASTGVHGANRLASNSLLEGLVFGHRVAAAASKIAADQYTRRACRQILGQEPSAGEKKVGRALRKRLQTLMWSQAGLIRDAAGLKAAREQIGKWWSAADYIFTDPELTETGNMLLIAAMMVEAAAVRRESRGCHYRRDYPGSDPELSRSHLIFQRQVQSRMTDTPVEYPQPLFTVK